VFLVRRKSVLSFGTNARYVKFWILAKNIISAWSIDGQRSVGESEVDEEMDLLRGGTEFFSFLLSLTLRLTVST
jgi:hypothetical protein